VGSLRFRKQLKLAPGLTLNLNKQSASISVGRRGARMTYNTKGQLTTSVGLPGTGITYRDTRKIRPTTTARTAQRIRPQTVRDPSRVPVWANEINGTPLAITFVQKDASYDLWVCEPHRMAPIPGMSYPQPGFWWLSARFGTDYTKARQAAEVWERYLRDGGTVSAWRKRARPSLDNERSTITGTSLYKRPPPDR
jgi:hypothetical protein